MVLVIRRIKFRFLKTLKQAAVDATTRNLALEWGTDYDIRVNGIAPGPIEGTPGMSKLVPEEIESKAREYMPLYKLGEKWDIAMAALYLSCDSGMSLYHTHFFFFFYRAGWLDDETLLDLVLNREICEWTDNGGR